MALDKESKTTEKKQYHTHLKPGDIGNYVPLLGDPARSDRVAQCLENAELTVNNEEHRTFAGYYKGVKMPVTSTGMGCPSAAIAAEGLMSIGAECLIRIGSSAALQKDIKTGDLMISTGSTKNEGTSRFYVPDHFPAAPDPNLTRIVIDTAREIQPQLYGRVYYGVNASDDTFYGETQEWIKKLSSLGCLNVEMESSAPYTVCHRRKKRAATISAVSGSLVTGEVIYETTNQGLARGQDEKIKIALETIHRFEQEQTQCCTDDAENQKRKVKNMGEQKAMHLDITSDRVSKYVLLPGSMGRVALIAEHSDNPVKIAHKREFPTYTGTLEGVSMTVTSTGIGGPSACIAIEEPHSCGAHTVMRVGSAVSTSQKAKTRDVAIPNDAVRMEGTGNHYFPFEFPAVPDFGMLRVLETAALKLGYSYNVGIIITEDSYYIEAEPETKPVHGELKYKWDSYVKGGATNISMECAILPLIGVLLGVRTSSMMISATNFGEYPNDAVDYPDRWEQRAIEVGIEVMGQIIPQDKEKGITM